VRLLQQPSELVEVSPPQGGDERMHAIDLRVHVAAALWVAGFRLAPALVVRRGRKRAVLPRIDDGDGELVGEGHRLVLERGAVEQQCVPTLSEGGGELIHDAHLDAGRTLLRTLAYKRRLLSVHVRPQAGRDGNKQCSR